MYCDRCGSELTDTAKRCPACGKERIALVSTRREGLSEFLESGEEILVERSLERNLIEDCMSDLYVGSVYYLCL
ncbi:MAG: zinc-ribbon domain-containing protein [Promethearchaeota archaeon]